MSDGITIDMVMKEKTFSTKEIADNLDIADSTLRKWCLILEERGYAFRRDGFERREFTEHDAIALRKFKELTKEGAMSLEDAAIAVKTGYSKGDRNAVSVPAIKEDGRYEERLIRMEEKMDQLFDQMEKQMQFNQALLAKLDEQKEYIEGSLDARDERLLESIRVINARKEIAAAEEQAKPDEKGFWARIFGK